MTKISFADCSVLLHDQHAHMRRLIWGALKEIGFERVHDCRDVSDLLHVFLRVRPDLLLLDLDVDHDQVCRLIQDIRLQSAGNDPFVVIIASTWNPEEDIVQKVLGVGADDIVAKPISVQILADRVKNLVRNRKDFVVTDEYVGPDRRSGKRDNDTVGVKTLAVPNRLRVNAMGAEIGGLDEDLADAALQAVAFHKLRLLSRDLSDRAGEIERGLHIGLGGAPNDDVIKELMDRVGQICEIVSGRRLDSHMRLAKSMRQVMRNIAAPGPPTARDFEILRLNSQAIAAALDTVEQEVATTVSALDSVKRTTRGRRTTL